MNIFFQIYFMDQNIYFCPLCRLKNRLQLKYQKVIVHTVASDSEQSNMSLS
jgi:hypothetical protein